MPPALRGARAAVVFLTRLPVGGRDYRDADWRWSTGWFPFVGLLLGAALAGVWILAEPLSPLVRAVLVTIAGLMLTGAFHEDGLADTADALGGAYDRGKLMTILKDSRLGTFGVAALCLSLLLRITLLAELESAAPLALIASGCLARVPPIWLMAAMPYVTEDDAAKSRQVTRAGWPQAALASLWGAALLAGLLSQQQLDVAHLAPLLGALVATALLCAWRFRVRAGGITGDFLGANEQLNEAAVLLVFAVVL